MPDDQHPPWRALQRAEGLVARTVRSTAMLESFRQNYGWRRGPERIVRPTPLPHNTPHVDRSEPLRRVTFPTFEIASNPTISLSEIRNRRFDLIDGERRRPRVVPEIQRLLEGLVVAFRQPKVEPLPPRPELPRRSRYEVLAA